MKRRAIAARRRPKNKQPEVILVRSGSVTTRIYTTEKSGNCYYSVASTCLMRLLIVDLYGAILTLLSPPALTQPVPHKQHNVYAICADCSELG